jgi:hypothetical protein
MDETELVPEATAQLVGTLRSAVLVVGRRLGVQRTGSGER